MKNLYIQQIWWKYFVDEAINSMKINGFRNKLKCLRKSFINWKFEIVESQNNN